MSSSSVNLHDATAESRPLLWEPDREALREETDEVVADTRALARHFFTSKLGHYCILLLVSIDVSLIFADFILTLYVCEHTCKRPDAYRPPGYDEDMSGFERAQDVLGGISLVFSYLFMLELLASIWAFGLGYFRSKFHCFDAFVIVAGFILDVFLAGVLEEVGSIVVVLRLWRVVKIIEELSSEAVEQIDAIAELLEHAEAERDHLRSQLETLRKRPPRLEHHYDGDEE